MMVYCDPDMCESELGKLMQAFRADRPSEWQMDEFIQMAEQMHKHIVTLRSMSDERCRLLKNVVAIVDESTGVYGYHLNGDVASWGEFEEISEIFKHLYDLE